MSLIDQMLEAWTSREAQTGDEMYTYHFLQPGRYPGYLQAYDGPRVISERVPCVVVCTRTGNNSTKVFCDGTFDVRVTRHANRVRVGLFLADGTLVLDNWQPFEGMSPGEVVTVKGRP